MTLKLSSISNWPNKKTKYRGFPLEDWDNGFNDALSQAGSLELSVNEENAKEVIMCVFLIMQDEQLKEAIKRTNKEGLGWSTEGWVLETKDIAERITSALSAALPSLLEIKGVER